MPITQPTILYVRWGGLGAQEVGSEQRGPGDEATGQRADGGGEGPSELEGSPGVDADQTAGLEVGRHGAEGETDLGPFQQQVDEHQSDEHGHPDAEVGVGDADLEDVDVVAEPARERCREGLRVEPPYDAGNR